MIKDNTRTLIVKDEDLVEPEDHECIKKVGCYGTYNISYGFIIRMIWRLSAVSARFVIFALIWVVLGGAFEIIYIPVMVIFWYLALFFYATRGNFKGTMEVIRESILKEIREICEDGVKGCCLVFLGSVFLYVQILSMFII